MDDAVPARQTAAVPRIAARRLDDAKMRSEYTEFIVDEVRRILADITQNDAVLDMGLNTTLREELGVDSMTSLMFLMALEDNIPGFMVDAATLEADHFRTIGS